MSNQYRRYKASSVKWPFSYLRFCGIDYKKTTWTKEKYLTVRFISGINTVGSGFQATVTVMSS